MCDKAYNNFVSYRTAARARVPTRHPKDVLADSALVAYLMVPIMTPLVMAVKVDNVEEI